MSLYLLGLIARLLILVYICISIRLSIFLEMSINKQKTTRVTQVTKIYKSRFSIYSGSWLPHTSYSIAAPLSRTPRQIVSYNMGLSHYISFWDFNEPFGLHKQLTPFGHLKRTRGKDWLRPESACFSNCRISVFHAAVNIPITFGS